MRILFERAIDNLVVWGAVLLILPQAFGRMRGQVFARFAIAKAERAVRRKIKNARREVRR